MYNKYIVQSTGQLEDYNELHCKNATSLNARTMKASILCECVHVRMCVRKVYSRRARLAAKKTFFILSFVVEIRRGCVCIVYLCDSYVVAYGQREIG